MKFPKQMRTRLLVLQRTSFSNKEMPSISDPTVDIHQRGNRINVAPWHTFDSEKRRIDSDD